KPFNDKFLVLLASKSYTGNISLDGKGNPVTVNNAFFTVTSPAALAGTGMEKMDAMGRPYGGATGWLTTTASVTPSEKITLRFILFDEGDGLFDSQVLLDNFRWSATPLCTGPETGRGDAGQPVACPLTDG